ncbi:hypothetical protein DPEC_G00346270 [Dallia pectoralis]|uniref:Uncharacterized protein n=1 Tax=Dallia pectoralis TaxID=75939 RepID=A0ACC2F3R7_DALPE|nr:hypothetical protein DPEC_G00346270 [Dallia pectoralis]
MSEYESTSLTQHYATASQLITFDSQNSSSLLLVPREPGKEHWLVAPAPTPPWPAPVLAANRDLQTQAGSHNGELFTIALIYASYGSKCYSRSDNEWDSAGFAAKSSHLPIDPV